jgi:hypothetical protein
MAQIFHRSTNVLSRLSIYGGVFIVVLLGAALYGLELSPTYTNMGVAREQPVPFSHKHHVGDLGIDCRYCHTSVEKSSFAGIPPTQTCMTCHSQSWTNAPMLQPVRTSYQTDKSISWTRVNALPDFVYFDHSIHVSKGVGCTTCHGQIAEMPLTWRAETLYMSWCLNCHRGPEHYLRQKSEVFNPTYRPPDDQVELGLKLMTENKVQKLTNCSTCHR